MPPSSIKGNHTGFGLVVYSFWWATENRPFNYDPGGLSGIRVGLGLGLVGLVVGFVFLFVPPQRTTGYDPAAGADLWRQSAQWVHGRWWIARITSWVGLGLFLLTLLVAAYVLRDDVLAGGASEDYELAAIPGTYAGWTTFWLVLALAGAVVWIGFTLRAQGLRYALEGYLAASGARPAAAARTAPAAAVAGLRDEELSALMKRLDGLLAQLPDEVVANFSKTKEAETYLKLLGGKS